MLLWMGLILAVVSAYLEIKLILALPKQFSAWVMKNTIVSILLSITISYHVGHLFDGTGVVAMIGAFGCTAITTGFYKLYPYLQEWRKQEEEELGIEGNPQTN